MVAYVAAFVVNAAVRLRHRAQPLLFGHWLALVGLPSIVHVLVLGGVGTWPHRTAAAARSTSPA